MNNLQEWALSEKFGWGYVWISTETEERLEYHIEDMSFILNDYYVMRNPDHLTYQQYFSLLVRDNLDE